MLTTVAPLGGLSSSTLPIPDSSNILIALTAPSLLPLSRNRLLARRALIYSIFPGSKRQNVATSPSWEQDPVAMIREAMQKDYYHNHTRIALCMHIHNCRAMITQSGLACQHALYMCTYVFPQVSECVQLILIFHTFVDVLNSFL